MDTKKEIKPENQIRIGANSGVGGVVRYVNSLIKDKKFREYNFSAIGIAIGKLVSAVELLKVVNPGFYQVNKIETISYDSKDTTGNATQRLYPKLEVILSLDEPKEKGPGYQVKLDEKERTKLFELLNSNPVSSEGGADRGSRGTRSRGQRGSFRGRGDYGGRSRGGDYGGRGRGGDYGGRGGDYGGRGGDYGGRDRDYGGRGGDYGVRRSFGGRSRGNFGGSSRGNFGEGSRGNYGESSRGSYRGSSRGSFGGNSRGNFGESRGNFARGGRGERRGAGRGGQRGGFEKEDY